MIEKKKQAHRLFHTHRNNTHLFSEHCPTLISVLFRLRVLGYPNTQVVLICFAFDSPDSLACVMDKWAPEVKHYCHNVPILLIANKRDLRDDAFVHERIRNQNQKIITTEDAMLCAKKIGARNYLECSAKTREGVQEVFEYAARIALDRNRHEKCFCQCHLL
jgi:GTPase SAR1 family protein